MRRRTVSMNIEAAVRALTMASAAATFSWRMTVPEGIVAAGLAAAIGVLAGHRAAGSRVRLWAILASAALALLVGTLLASVLRSADFPSALIGASAAFTVGECLLWVSIILPLTAAMRACAQRIPSLAVIELLFAATALAASVGAHRDGRIHRPLAISDWAWTHGISPVMIFLVIGGAGSIVLAGFLIAEQRKRRWPLHLAVLALLAVGLLFIIRLTGIPKPPSGSDLGLTGAPSERRAQGSDGRSSGSQGGSRSGSPGRDGGSAESGREHGDGSQGESGAEMGDIQFKNEYSSSGGESPVAVVLLHGDYSPPSGAFYFRQSAFSQFNGQRLVQATRGEVDTDIVESFPVEKIKLPDAPPASKERSALKTTVGLLTDHLKPFALDSPASLWPAQNPDQMQFRRAYGVLSMVPTLAYEEMLKHKPGDPSWTSEQWAHYTAAPSDPRYGELADKIVEVLRADFKEDPLAQAVAVKMWLDRNGIYSRKSRHADAGDPTASFLFGDLTGYCVHFAHAATYLLRARGVPTRVGAGYAVAEGDRGNGSAILVRAGSAHAWPEIRIDGIGWVIVDLQPERSLDPPEQPNDQDLQRMLGEMLRQSPGEDAQAGAARPGISGKALLRGFAKTLLLILALAYILKLYRAIVPLVAPRASLYRVGYRAALDRLADAGMRRRAGESREDFARRARGLAPSFEALTVAHVSTALGSRAAPDLAVMRRAAAVVAGEVFRNAPAWRSIPGLLNPLSWIAAR